MGRKRKSYISRDAENSGEAHTLIRRTITVDDSVNRVINQMRGRLLMKYDIELDYTSAFNMFAMLGLSRFQKEKELTESEWAIVNKYVFGVKELKWEGLMDQMQDQFIKNTLPTMLDEIVKRRSQQSEKKED